LEEKGREKRAIIEYITWKRGEGWIMDTILTWGENIGDTGSREGGLDLTGVTFLT